MKRFLVIMITMVFAMFILACSDEKSTAADNETVTDNETADNEVIDDAADENVDDSTAKDDENTNDTNVVDDSENPDSNVETDNENSDSIVETDEEFIDDNSEKNDEHGEGDDPDEDRVKPDPVDCQEGFVGLTIKATYNDGTENVDGGGTITRTPAGTPTEDPDTTCYAANTDVALTVVPDADFNFSQWKGKGAGSITGTYPDFSLKLVNSVMIRAEFVAK